MRINIDSDGVVYDLTTAMIDVEHLETGKRHAQPDEWDIAKAWGVPGDRIFDLFGRRGMFLDGDPYPGAVEGIEALVAERHDVRIVTSKHFLPNAAQAMFDTIAFYKRIGLLDKVDMAFPRGNKTSYPADVVVDDKPTLEWAQPNALNLLMSQPWNEATRLDEVDVEVWRAEDWRDLVYVIASIEL